MKLVRGDTEVVVFLLLGLIFIYLFIFNGLMGEVLLFYFMVFLWLPMRGGNIEDLFGFYEC